MTGKGIGMNFLTPGRKIPSLKTTVTKPDSTFFENASYMRSISSLAKSSHNAHYMSVLSDGLELKKSDVYQTDSDLNSHDDMHNIEGQIIPETLVKTKTEGKFNMPSVSQLENEIDEDQITPALLTQRKVNDGVNTQPTRRRYTSSFCSSSGDESVTVQPRSEVCDGCSISTTNSLSSQHGGDCNDSGIFPLEMSDCSIEALLDEHLAFDRHDTSNPVYKQDAPNIPEVKMHKLSLSNEQMIFLLLRMVLSRYKQLTDDLVMERKVSASQRRSIGCLIQAVLLLSRRVKINSDQWTKMQQQLQSVKRDYEKTRSHQRKIYALLCVLFVYNISNLAVVRERISRIIKYFGMVENARKINRFRKMVAENWRNIPLLLTDFWRIFIFRSNTRLKRS